MIFQVYSVYDVKAECFHPPFFIPTDGQAMRSFADLVNDASTFVHKHPEDYKLVRIGRFNDGSGYLESTEPETLTWAKDCVVKEDDRQLKMVP